MTQTAAGLFGDEGQTLTASEHEPLLLRDAGSTWYVERGGMLLFTIAVKDGHPYGTREYFTNIGAGACCFGFDSAAAGLPGEVLAVPQDGTVLRRLQRANAEECLTRAGEAGAAAIDAWVSNLSRAVTADAPAPLAPARLVAGQPVELPADGVATSAEGVVWVLARSGSILFGDAALPDFDGELPLPVAPSTTVRPAPSAGAGLSFTAMSTLDALRHPGVWRGLDVFHRLVAACELGRRRRAIAEETSRLESKRAQRQADDDAAFATIAAVLRKPVATVEAAAPGATEQLLQACALIGETLGLEVTAHPGADRTLTFDELLNGIADASGFRTRSVALTARWYREDNGPLLCRNAETGEPVAVIPAKRGRYVAVNTATGERAAVTPQVAARLAEFAYAFYRPFPAGPLTVRTLIAFGCRGLRADLRTLVITALAIGMVGTLTPYLMAQVFSAAIPHAERMALLGLAGAMLLSAAAGSIFTLIQGIATVRIETRMSSGIQAAVWDRLLTLPVNFFRDYEAGDLADRADGAVQIQSLVSGAGVAAILGAISAQFYVTQMIVYSPRLALAGVLLTVVFLATALAANLAQLRYQRHAFTMRGRVAGLVLSLISGVSKLRVSGAESHAFRIWAEQFAEQRRITLKAASVQNMAASFATVFPLVSSLVLFFVMMDQRTSSGTAAFTTSEFIAFYTAFGLFLASMQALADASLSLLKVVPLYERLKPMLTVAPELSASRLFPGQLKGAVELSHVHFRYSPDGPWIIDDLSLRIEPGEFVAFVGESGCGKSTLMRLMLGFEQPATGAIYYDGQDLASLDARMVRQQIGVVLQVSRVMPGEIYRNITGMTARTVDDAWAAAEQAGIADDIRDMPMGMYTYVSEEGSTLSGGQRQRLMIARAIVNRPKLLFLDEATSALDNRAQAIVTESMGQLDATRVVIAHRLSTIIHANRICYLEGGRIVEMGTYEELMAKDGKFARLARRQLAEQPGEAGSVASAGS